MTLMRAIHVSITLLAAIPFSVAIPVRAQNAQQTPDAGIRIKVQVVNAPVAVRDSKNWVILNLEKENFTILDNKIKQAIESFDLAGEPLSTVLVVETSSRVAPLLAAIGGDLNTQYTLTYEPTKSDRPGYHEIKIQVDRRGLKVRTRPGYYLEAQ